MKKLELIEKKHPLTQLYYAEEVQKMCVNNKKLDGLWYFFREIKLISIDLLQLFSLRFERLWR